MFPSEAQSPENQLVSAAMGDRKTLKIGGGPLDPLVAADGFGGFLSTIFVVLALGAVVFATLSSGSGEPLILTCLALLAMLGMFFVFGVFAGHIRIGARMPAGDVLKAATETGSDAWFISHANGSALYWNSATEALFGKSGGGPVAAIETICAGDPEAAQALFRLVRAAERGETRREDIRVKLFDVASRPSWLRLTVRPFSVPERAAHDTAGRNTMTFWQVTDISDDKLREAERIGNLESALTAFDTMPAGFVAVSRDGVVTHINASFEEWLGYTRGSLRVRGQKLPELAGEDGARLLTSLSKDTDAERRIIDLDLHRKDGRLLPLTLAVEPAVLGYDSGFTITAVHRAIGGLSVRDPSNDVRVSEFFQSAPFGFATIDTGGNIANCNAAFARLVLEGRPAQGINALDALCRNADAVERASVATGLTEVLAARGNVQPVEITAGSQKQSSYRLYMNPLAAVPGGQAAALYVIDTTEQKHLEQRFAQAQKMEAVGKLAGGIAHDFNNVLTAIIGFSDLLLQTHRPSDPAYKDIKNIQSAANRAAGLVANLLGFSRKQTQQVSVLDLGEVATDLTPILKTSLSEKIELKIQSERDLWYVRADRSQIDNVMINLSVNARDAMPNGGKLTIRTRNVPERETQKMVQVAGFTAGEYVLIEVEDTGTGMSADVMTKIFEPFFTTKAVGKGTGLGLASVYGIVKQSGGFIMPESEIGKGTTFKVYLPRYLPENDDDIEPAHAQKAAAKKEAKAVDLTGTGRVLLVEDEIEVRQFAVRALRRQGYQVLEAGDGVEALQVMEGNPGTVDIVVSDVVMPEMDGPTLFKELRKRNPTMKVIFVSGYPNEAFRETLGTEDFAFLPKPFSLPQLAAKVKEELAR